MKRFAFAAVGAFFILAPHTAGHAQDAQSEAVNSQSRLLTDLANDTGWADLATSCHLRSDGWNKLIHDKATVSILMLDEQLHLDGPHRDAIGDTVHDIAADVAKKNTCRQVTPAILRVLDGIAVSP